MFSINSLISRTKNSSTIERLILKSIKYLFNLNQNIIKNFQCIFGCKLNLISFFANVIIYLIKFFYKKLALSIFTKLIFIGLIYIGDVPLGIKQNTVIKEGLNLIFNLLLDLQVYFLNNFYLIFILTNQDVFFIKISVIFASSIYKLLLNIIIDVVELFRGKTYNKLKKRYDSVELTIDQIIMSVLLFSISILVYINIIIYYINYIVVYIVFVFLQILENYFVLIVFRLINNKNEKASVNFHDYFYGNLSERLNLKNILLGRINL